jgi:hypothetical protein
VPNGPEGVCMCVCVRSRTLRLLQMVLTLIVILGANSYTPLMRGEQFQPSIRSQRRAPSTRHQLHAEPDPLQPHTLLLAGACSFLLAGAPCSLLARAPCSFPQPNCAASGACQEHWGMHYTRASDADTSPLCQPPFEGAEGCSLGVHDECVVHHTPD